jgi:hypothetical protein
MRDAYKTLVKECEGKRPLERHMPTWLDIKIFIKLIGREA